MCAIVDNFCVRTYPRWYTRGSGVFIHRASLACLWRWRYNPVLRFFVFFITWVEQSVAVWQACLEQLREELPQNLFNTWIRPLQADEQDEQLRLLAPNRFIVDFVVDRFLHRIRELALELSQGHVQQVRLEVGSRTDRAASAVAAGAAVTSAVSRPLPASAVAEVASPRFDNKLNPTFTFDNFVTGKSNQLALAACTQVASHLGDNTYNPLFIYGPTGLGKTHLMHSVGNAVLRANPSAKVLYLHSERFVEDFVTAMQKKVMNEFKRMYRSLDVLMIDDIQFFAGKNASQEEFFHTFNALLEGSRQIILTSDKFPKEINDLDERLKSRFSWGLTVQVEPPELETRVAILMKKAEQNTVALPQSAAFFIAQHVQANVRELEGALNKVIATARFKGKTIDMDLVKDSLRDVLAVRAKLISIENIQKVTAEYYKIPLRELVGKKRNRSYARPRQLAMALARELTSHSLPEIGDAFDGRDHTTVMHACRQIVDLRKTEPNIEEDYLNLLRLLQA